MSERAKRDELFDLMGAVSNETMTPEEHRRLEQILSEDAEARRFYLDYAEVDFGLRQLQRRDKEALPLSVLREELARLPVEPASKGRFFSLPLRYALVATATLCVSFLAQFFVASSRPAAVVRGPVAKPAEPAPGAPRKTEYVATLGRTSDCVWESDDAPRRVGWRLLPGDFRLKKGVAEIRFDSGADMVIEGPAVLRIESVTAAAVLLGKAVLKSDETAEPFVLHTPASTLLDYGTEYAVSVGASSEEVHVFDGVVRRKPQGAGAIEAEPEQLAAGQAKRYARTLPPAGRPVPLENAHFVREVAEPDAAAPRPAAGLLAYEGFEYQTPEALSSGKADGGIGWAKPWTGSIVAPMTLNLNEGLAGPQGVTPSVGGAIDYAGVSAIHRELASPVRLDEDGVYYFSFLFRRDGDDPAPPNTFSLTLRNPQQTEPQKRLVVGVARSNHVVFTHFEGGGARAAFPLAYDRTYLIVGKIVAGHTRPDQVFLRVYRPEQPVDRREPASWSVASRPVRSDVTLNVLTISVDSQSRQMIDEIRIGATWGSVTSAGSGLPASHASRPPGLDEQVE